MKYRLLGGGQFHNIFFSIDHRGLRLNLRPKKWNPLQSVAFEIRRKNYYLCFLSLAPNSPWWNETVFLLLLWNGTIFDIFIYWNAVGFFDLDNHRICCRCCLACFLSTHRNRLTCKWFTASLLLKYLLEMCHNWDQKREKMFYSHCSIVRYIRYVLRVFLRCC